MAVSKSSSLGGQSRVGGAVLVTSSGKPVASTTPAISGNKGVGSSDNSTPANFTPANPSIPQIKVGVGSSGGQTLTDTPSANLIQSQQTINQSSIKQPLTDVQLLNQRNFAIQQYISQTNDRPDSTDVGSYNFRKRINKFYEEQRQQQNKERVKEAIETGFGTKNQPIPSRLVSSSISKQNLPSNKLPTPRPLPPPNAKPETNLLNQYEIEYLKTLGKLATSPIAGFGKLAYANLEGIPRSFLKRSGFNKQLDFVDNEIYSRPLSKEIRKNAEQVRNNPLSDRDVQNLFITTGFIAAEAVGSVPAILATGAGAYFGGKSIYKFAKSPSPETAAEATIGVLALIPGVRAVKTGYYKTIANPVKLEATPSIFSSEVLPYARERATFLPEVVDANGNSLGIVLAKNKQGEYISLGGLIEKGETSLQAALRESVEESGLNIKDINNLKSQTRYATPEEIQNIFTGQISKATFDKLKASSDVTEFKIFKPSEFEKIGGVTPKNPRNIPSGNIIKKVLGIADDVRVTEAYLLGRFNKINEIDLKISGFNTEQKAALVSEAKSSLTKRFGEEKVTSLTEKEFITDYLLAEKNALPTSAYIQTPKGKLYLAQQSRYNIPGLTQENYFQDIINKPIYKNIVKYFDSSRMSLSGFDELFTQQLNINKVVDRRDFKNPQLITSGTFRPLKLVDRRLEVIKGLAQRSQADVLFFQPPVAPGKSGYVGLSYVLGGAEEVSLSIFPKARSQSRILYSKSVIDKELFDLARSLKDQGYGLKEAQRILNEKATPGKVGATAKTAYGVETEFGATPGTIFELTGEKQVNIIEGRPVFTSNIKRITNINKLKETSNLYKDLDNAKSLATRELIAKRIESRSGINPLDFEMPKNVRNIALLEQIKGLKSNEGKIVNRLNDEVKPFSREIEATNFRESNRSASDITQPFATEETLTIIERLNRIPSPFEPEIPSEFQEFFEPLNPTGSSRTPPRLNNPNLPPILREIQKSKDERRKRMRRAQAYSVLLKRRSKIKGRYEFVPIATNLPRGRALRFGAERAVNELSRRFKIIQSGTTELEDINFRPNPKQFRDYRVSRGRKVPLDIDNYIQKTSANLQTISEKVLIKQAKQMKGQFI